MIQDKKEQEEKQAHMTKEELIEAEKEKAKI